MKNDGDPSLPRYTGVPRHGDASRHDGKLRPVVGVHEVQTVRSNPTHPDQADGHPFDFRHHPFLMYWQRRFWVYHLAAVGADESSKRGILQWSDDGVRWDRASSTVAFPQATHQRAAFYVAANGRAFVTTWYGKVEAARGQKGSRLVREVIGPGSMGPVYLLKANHRGPADGVAAEHFTAATDAGFREACAELLGNRIYVQQWQEEDQDPEMYAVNQIGTSPMARGFAWYTLADGRVVGMWKGPHLVVAQSNAWQARSVPLPQKEVTHWDVNRLTEFDQFGANGGSKQWGQRLAGERYAMVFNAPGELHKRWPLALTTSSDGLTFDSPLLCVSGDISPQRYADASFDHKDGGPAYVRGIEPSMPSPPDDAMWLTYSLNKEDIWVARVPVPIRSDVTGDIDDDFSDTPLDTPASASTHPILRNWNIRSAFLAPVELARVDGRTLLRLSDRDPVDYARAVRVFEQGCAVEVRISLVGIRVEQGTFCIDVVDATGGRPVRLDLHPAGTIRIETPAGEMRELGRFRVGEIVDVRLAIDCAASHVVVSIAEAESTTWPMVEAVETVERVEFRTGAYRLDRFDRIAHYGEGFDKRDLAGADAAIPEASYGLARLRVRRIIR